MLNSYELRFDLKDSGSLMLKDNPPKTIKARISAAKTNLEMKMFNKRVAGSVKENLDFWD